MEKQKKPDYGLKICPALNLPILLMVEKVEYGKNHRIETDGKIEVDSILA